MCKGFTISLLALYLCGVVLGAGLSHQTHPPIQKSTAPKSVVLGARPSHQALLRDGFALVGTDGKVFCVTDHPAWFFDLDTDVNDDMSVVKAGTRLELLSSSTLEKMAEDMEIRSGSDYRLWGRAAKYKNKNFIFPYYFLPLSKIKQSQSESPEPQAESRDGSPLIEKEQTQLTVNELNDVLAIPQEVIEKLRTGRMAAKWPGARAGSIIQPPQVEMVKHNILQDFILADRTAVLERQNDGQIIFILDALGLNAPEVSLRLLPCETLELAENTRSTELEPMKFKIAGIITEYKGDKFLLLQKATRVYSYGNFGR